MNLDRHSASSETMSSSVDRIAGWLLVARDALFLVDRVVEVVLRHRRVISTCDSMP